MRDEIQVERYPQAAKLDVRGQLKRSVILLLLMLASGGLGALAQPDSPAVGLRGLSPYEDTIPLAFGDWVMFDSAHLQVVNPQQRQTLDLIYQQTITRVYRDTATGDVVMLSIAYGDAQTKEAQVHLPERCYPAQGFEIRDSWRYELPIQPEFLPTRRMVAELGGRREAVTYWIRLGSGIVLNALEQKLATISEGLRGRVADGLIFRVSTVGPDERRGFAAQDKFIREILQAVSPDHLPTLVGDRS